MDGSVLHFTGEVWRYPGEAGWHFITLPPDIADDIDGEVGERAGFGSIPIEVTIGTSTWCTSLFPDKASASFVLPVKKAIRQAEHLESGTQVEVRLRHKVERT